MLSQIGLLVAVAMMLPLTASGHEPLPGGAQGAAAAGAYPVVGETAKDHDFWWAASDKGVIAVWKDGRSGYWDVQTGERVCAFTIEHYQPRHFRCFAAIAKPELVVFEGDPATSVRLYDLRTGVLTKTLKAAGYLPGPRPFSVPSSVAVSQDGRYLLGASALDKLVFAIDLRNGKTAWSFHNDNILVGAGNVLFAPDGKRALIVALRQGTDVPLPGRQCVVYSSQGKRLWDWSTDRSDAWLLAHKAAGRDGAVTFSVMEMVPDPRQPDRVSRCVGFSADGRKIWEYSRPVVAIDPNGIRRIVADDIPHVSLLLYPYEQGSNAPLGFGPVGMAFTADGAHLLSLPNLVTDRREQVLEGRRVVLCQRASDLLQVTSADTREVLRKIRLAKPAIAGPSKSSQELAAH